MSIDAARPADSSSVTRAVSRCQLYTRPVEKVIRIG